MVGLVGSGPSRSWSEGGFVRRGPPVRRRAAHAYAAVAAAGVATAGWFHVLRRQRRREAELLVAHQGQRLDSDQTKYLPRRRFASAREAVRHLSAGAMAGALAKSLEAPVDRVKIILQVSPERFSFARGARITRDILEREGVRGLWKGNSTVLARTLPYAAINFAMHDLVAGLLSEDGERLRVEQKFAAGAVAGMCSTTVTYPLDMVRARMAVAPRGSPSTVMSTMRGIYRRSGLRGLYAGLTPSLCGIIPYSGTTWMCFNSFKEALAIRKGQDPAHAHLSGLEHAVLGGVSAIIGQAVSYPLDTCRRRMQTARVAGGVTMSMVGVLRDIFAKEGFHGLYKGLTVNFVKAPIAHGISFASYHHIKQEMAARDWP